MSSRPTMLCLISDKRVLISCNLGETDCVYLSSFGTGSLIHTKWWMLGDICSATYFCKSRSPNSGAPNVIHFTDLFWNKRFKPMNNLIATMDAIAPPRECPHTTISIPLNSFSSRILSSGNNSARFKNPEWNFPVINEDWHASRTA